MKQRKKTTLIVLVLEIAVIVALHAIKINHGGKVFNAKDIGKNVTSGHQEVSNRNNQHFYSFAGL